MKAEVEDVRTKKRDFDFKRDLHDDKPVAPVIEPTLPVAEIFESTQGEGHNAGIAMTFIRLAGCTVGKPYTPDARKELGLEGYQERCTDWAGNSFSCDTNYKLSKRYTVKQLIQMPEIVNAEWVSITGGEPLMHDLGDLFSALYRAGKRIHLETSATIDFVPPFWALDRSAGRMWIAVSPKLNFTHLMLFRADEIRVLVDKDFDEPKFMQTFGSFMYQDKVWISPVNDLMTLNVDNMAKCLQLQHKYRKLRLTIQQHKIWRVR